MRATLALPRYPNAVIIERAAFAAAVAVAKNERSVEVAKRLWNNDRKVQAALLGQRAAVEPATTGGWAGELVGDAYRQFLASLQPISAASRLIALGMQAELAGIGEAKYPARAGNPSAVPWVSESGAIPVAARTITSVTLGPTKKIALIIVSTRETLLRGDAEAVFTQILKEDSAYTLDAAVFSTAAGSGSAHAGLLNGVSPLVASSLGGEHAAREDLSALVEAVAVNGSGEAVLIVSTARAATLPLRFPTLADKVTVLASPAVPADRVVAVDPQSVIFSVDTIPTIDASKNAAIHMSDEPTQLSAAGSPNTVAAPIVSMFQSDLVATRLLADMAWVKRRAGAVAYTDNVDWSFA